MSSSTNDNESGIDRRTMLSALAATAGVGIAGCNSNTLTGGGNSDQQLGERVPAITGVAISGVAGAKNIEQAMLHIGEQVSNVLGVPMNVEARESAAFLESVRNDARSTSFYIDLIVPTATHLDPSRILRDFHIRGAGARAGSTNNYANCEFSRKTEMQGKAATEEKRRQHVADALSISSEDIMPIPLTQITSGGAYRTDQLSPPSDLGEKGVVASNSELLWYTETKEGVDAKKIATTGVGNPVFHTGAKRIWFTTVYLPLIYRDNNYQLKGGLASDWEVTNDLQTFTFTLRDDATFHNGEPVTAEDAKWTIEWINQYAPQFESIGEYNYESINAIDETTLEVNMNDSDPGWLQVFAPSWSCVLPKDIWIEAGAEDGPSNTNLNEIIGSGPYQVVQHTTDQILALEPYEGHFIDAVDNLTFQQFQSAQSGLRAIQEGAINIFSDITNSDAELLRNQMGNTIETAISGTFASWRLMSQFSFAPTMFREFRLATSQAINRQKIRAFLENGQGNVELYSSLFPKTNPWRPESDESFVKAADSPQANPETARQVLRDAGWGWADDGRLHYPPDKDLTPPWPKGSSPCDNPENFECLPDLCDSY